MGYLDSVLEMYSEILDQFPKSISFNGFVLSRFVNLHTKHEELSEWDIPMLWFIKHFI